MSISSIILEKTKCRRYTQLLPSFTPIINSLSVTTSVSAGYSLVYVSGENFFPYGTTYINFGPYKQIPITFFNSFYISFVVPLNVPAGTYPVTAVNVYNGNFSPGVNFSYPANLNYSNSIAYTLT